MNDKLKQTILRSKIIESTFALSFNHSQEIAWLQKYTNSTGRLLGNPGAYILNPKDIEIDFSDFLTITLDIKSHDHFSATIRVGGILLWDHHVDPKYRTLHSKSIIQSHWTQVQKNLKISQIKSVLEDLLLHPEVHQHFVVPELNHEVRLGGGINNVYQFLIHLRMQLLQDTNSRQNEIDSMANAIFNHLNANSINVIDQKILYRWK